MKTAPQRRYNHTALVQYIAFVIAKHGESVISVSPLNANMQDGLTIETQSGLYWISPSGELQSDFCGRLHPYSTLKNPKLFEQALNTSAVNIMAFYKKLVLGRIICPWFSSKATMTPYQLS